MNFSDGVAMGRLRSREFACLCGIYIGGQDQNCTERPRQRWAGTREVGFEHYKAVLNGQIASLACGERISEAMGEA